MINEKRLLDNFLAYVQIDSETRNEKNMCDRMVADLQALGFEVQTDKAGEALAPTVTTFTLICGVSLAASRQSSPHTLIQ